MMFLHLFLVKFEMNHLIATLMLIHLLPLVLYILVVVFYMFR